MANGLKVRCLPIEQIAGELGKPVKVRHVPNAVKGMGRANATDVSGRRAVQMNLSQKTGRTL